VGVFIVKAIAWLKTKRTSPSNPMKHLACLSAATALLLTASLTPAWAADKEKQPGAIDFGKITPAAGGTFVEVNVKAQLISLAARLVEKEEPAAADLLRNLKAVRVNVVGLDEGNREELQGILKKLRSELDRSGWERIVTVQDKDEEVGVFVKHRGDEAIEGIVVTVVDGDKEAVLVNVVGDIDPEKIALLGEKLGIDPLKKAAKAAGKKKS
jgi:Domain of unknown function (DUF4252)